MASETIIQGDHANIAEQALMFRRYWNQEKTRTEKLDGDNRFLRRELDEVRAAVAELVEALKPFADCVEQISDDEDDEEWAKFRLLIKDYRRAVKAFSRHQENSNG